MVDELLVLVAAAIASKHSPPTSVLMRACVRVASTSMRASRRVLASTFLVAQAIGTSLSGVIQSLPASPPPLDVVLRVDPETAGQLAALSATADPADLARLLHALVERSGGVHGPFRITHVDHVEEEHHHQQQQQQQQPALVPPASGAALPM